ncbi:MAG: hypothetical protein ACI8PB_003262 [Desulforhopalus sp.]|jgi:hypothetical protein
MDMHHATAIICKAVKLTEVVHGRMVAALAVKNTSLDGRPSMLAPVVPYLYHPNFYLYSRHMLTSTIIQAASNLPQ